MVHFDAFDAFSVDALMHFDFESVIQVQQGRREGGGLCKSNLQDIV